MQSYSNAYINRAGLAGLLGAPHGQRWERRSQLCDDRRHVRVGPLCEERGQVGGDELCSFAAGGEYAQLGLDLLEPESQSEASNI